MVIYKLTCDILSKATHLDCHIPIYLSQKSLGLMEYSLNCLGHLTKMAATPIYSKTKYASLQAVVDLDLF